MTDAGSCSGAFMLLDAGRPVETVAVIEGGQVLLPPDSVRTGLGWELTPEGLCGDGICIPVPSESRLHGPHGVDLAELAALLDRPLAVDMEQRAAYLGVSAGHRRRALASLTAPDFTLPDLSGRAHSLAEHRGRKVLLVVWASW